MATDYGVCVCVRVCRRKPTETHRNLPKPTETHRNLSKTSETHRNLPKPTDTHPNPFRSHFGSRQGVHFGRRGSDSASGLGSSARGALVHTLSSSAQRSGLSCLSLILWAVECPAQQQAQMAAGRSSNQWLLQRGRFSWPAESPRRDTRQCA